MDKSNLLSKKIVDILKLSTDMLVIDHYIGDKLL